MSRGGEVVICRNVGTGGCQQHYTLLLFPQVPSYLLYGFGWDSLQSERNVIIPSPIAKFPFTAYPAPVCYSADILDVDCACICKHCLS